ncbi:ATP-dependent sacrificial sulfur transferase LarE [bacterium]|nr:ATP-dependent sacrificial sulfur transferase LarE [bacterium]
MSVFPSDLNDKISALRDFFRSCGSAAIAFSGGVDSTFLLKVAHDELGENVLAVTVISPLIPKKEAIDAENFCKNENIRHFVLELDPLKIPGFKENPENRCYICKKEIFSKIISLAFENGIFTVCDGSNADDTGDYRPGMQAIQELGIKSPLLECGFTKKDIRELSKIMGLPTWNRPSAACLASRFVYGETITENKLKMVENAEEFLHEKGFLQLRVRIHGENLARIEVNKEYFEKILRAKEEIINYFRSLGFVYTTLDLIGFRSGSMNEVIRK